MNDSESPPGGPPEEEPPSPPDEASSSPDEPASQPDEASSSPDEPPSSPDELPSPADEASSSPDEPPFTPAEHPPPPTEPPPAETPLTTGLAAPSSVAVADPSGPPSPDYPAGLEISYPSELNRWLPLVKWLLVIPHFIALFFVFIGAFFVLVYAFFVVLFTGRWPRGAFDYILGTLRWTYRVVAYFHLMTDAYPPFSLDEHPDYPVRLDVEYPEHLDRWRPLVQWLLAIPYLWVAGVLYWLTGVMTLIAFFTVLFTKRIPRGVFELMVPGLRWNLRGGAYAYFMTHHYPPFVWG